jgi:hypothetical protein
MAADTAIPANLDDDAVRVLRLAAALGDAIVDDVFVSFTTLLLALIYSENEASREFRRELNGFGTEERLLSVKPGKDGSPLDKGHVSSLATQVAGSPSDWPTGRPMLSTSAQKMVEVARVPDRATTVDDLVLAYLRQVPRSHRSDMDSWGLTEGVSARIADQFSAYSQNRGRSDGARETSSSTFSPSIVSGFDSDGSTVLWIAEGLAQNDKSIENPPSLHTFVLFAALAEGTALIGDVKRHPELDRWRH